MADPTPPDRVRIPAGMMQLAVILPSQYFVRRGRSAPERRLMIAVLQDAIECIERHRCAKDRRRQRLFNEVRQWLLSEQTDWLYSFARICEVLDLDANAVRHQLRVVPERLPVRASREIPSPMT